jgi:pantetheine-phosphate adenylyltransferase
MTKAVYAGTFDILTNGHCWMIDQGAALFDNLIVAIGENPGKHPVFSLGERIEMLKAVTHYANVTIGTFTGRYLVDYAKEMNAGFILRGVRNHQDFQYEQAMRNINADLAPGITTVVLMPPRELAEVSSSLVRGLIGPAGWEKVVLPYVPGYVLARLMDHYREVP